MKKLNNSRSPLRTAIWILMILLVLWGTKHIGKVLLTDFKIDPKIFLQTE